MGYFLPFHHCNNLKNDNFIKMKKTPIDIIILHNCTKNHDHMLYCSWDMACDTWNYYFSFWVIFCPFTPLTAQKIKISKKIKKTPGDIIILHMCTRKLWLDDVWFLIYGAQRTDRHRGRRKKWHKEVGAPPKNEKCHFDFGRYFTDHTIIPDH